MIKPCLFLLMLISFAQLFAQEDKIDYLIDSLVRKYGVKEMKIDLQSINFNSDTTMHLELRRFDKRGNKIESISPRHGSTFQRHIERYDTLDRRILFRAYDEKDTTYYYSETKWMYTDSMSHKKEQYYLGKLNEYSDYVTRTSGDTIWVTEDEYQLEYNKHYHNVSRYRMVGDTLLISEHIKFDDSLKMRDIDTYYRLNRDLDTGYLIMQGQYIPKSDRNEIYPNQELMIDLYRHPEKYLQMQLDGKFEFEYGDDPFTYQIYNYNNQLIQNDRGTFKSTFEYNTLGQLVKIIRWGENEMERYGDLIQTEIVTYEYNKDGFPIKISEQSLTQVSKRIYYYSYIY